MTREDFREITLTGLFIGFILFLSSIISLLAHKDMHNLEVVGTFLLPIILAYGIIGIFIRWKLYRNTIKKKSHSIFSGFASVYWIWLLCLAFMFLAYFIPQAIRYIMLSNAVTLFLMWLVDYLYLKNIAKELNTGFISLNSVLIEDLSSKPRNEDEFMEEIENYCKKNNLTLEIINYGLPAKIKMNSTQYLVKLNQYYSMVGTIIYTLEFHNITSKKGTNLD